MILFSNLVSIKINFRFQNSRKKFESIIIVHDLVYILNSIQHQFDDFMAQQIFQ